MKASSLRMAAHAVCCLLIAVFIPYTVQAQTAPKWAEDHLKAWYEAYNSGDAEGVASLYSASAIVLPPDDEPRKGRDEIRASFADGFQDTVYKCSGDFDGFQVMGDLATGWGHDACTETPKSGGASKETKTRWQATYRRHGDNWLIVYETYQSESE